MSGYNKFAAVCYSEELFSITEEENDAVMAEMWEGYQERSGELESQLDDSAWHGAKKVSGVLIKKACGHTDCPHFKCERGLRMGDFEL